MTAQAGTDWAGEEQYKQLYLFWFNCRKSQKECVASQENVAIQVI